LKRRYGKDARVKFVTLESIGNKWSFPVVDPPPPAVNGRGFAYIVHAGLDTDTSSTSLPDSGKSYGSHIVKGDSGGAGTVQVPVARLDDVLPIWASKIHLLKLDTQGWELRILQGALVALSQKRFSYVQFELSPWLMRRAQVLLLAH
jgi:hypothetical protein